MRRYSKPVYQGPQLRQMVELAEQSANIQVKRPTPLPQMRRLDRRLSAEMIAELVQAYRDGLTNHDAAIVATLYRSGATLAQLSEQFDVSYSAVRRALVSVGVVLRPRGGSKPHTIH